MWTVDEKKMWQLVKMIMFLSGFFIGLGLGLITNNELTIKFVGAFCIVVGFSPFILSIITPRLEKK